MGLAVTENHGTGGREGAKCVHALLCAVLLPEADGDVEENDTGKNTALDVIFDTEAQGHGKNKDLAKSLD